MTERTTVLFGAGASVDAGLPISNLLTEQIVRSINSSRHPGAPEVQALNRVIGSMIAHEAKQGGMPYDGMDVERAFSAIKMLSEKAALEIAPFVGSWTDSPLQPTNRFPSFWASDFKKAIVDRFDSKLEKSFSSAVRSLTLTETEPGVYRGLMNIMLAELRRILAVDDPKRFDYLSAVLALPQPLRIATLNYDLGVEAVAGMNGMDLDRGIERWGGGLDWEWLADSRFRLLKLHGSVDWTLGPPERPSDAPYFQLTSPVITLNDERGWASNWGWKYRPGIVFGARDKLQSEGPFLAMLYEFSRWLRDTDHLIIAGYSFRDDHINVMIREWLQSRTHPHISIIDPGLPNTLQDVPDRDSFLFWLMRGAIQSKNVQGADGTSEWRQVVTDGFELYREGTAVALPLACQPQLDLN